MHRQPLLDTLERYLERHPRDLVRVDHVRQFARAHPDCFERSCREGHITGSAWIVSRDCRRFLLAHHKKLDAWLQLGGHADGDPDPARVALREAREESGLEELELVAIGGGELPLDVDVHRIPARPGEPAHLHLDLRYLLLADHRLLLRPSVESHDLRWFDYADAERVLMEEGMRRMAQRALETLELAGV